VADDDGEAEALTGTLEPLPALGPVGGCAAVAVLAVKAPPAPVLPRG